MTPGGKTGGARPSCTPQAGRTPAGPRVPLSGSRSGWSSGPPPGRESLPTPALVRDAPLVKTAPPPAPVLADSDLQELFTDVRIGKEYLEGNFLPVREAEDPSVGDNLRVLEGAVPAGLRGALLRNGPNPTRRPFDGKHHWFDGDGMLHCATFAGRPDAPVVSYRGRIIRTLGRQVEEMLGATQDVFNGFRTMENLRLAANGLVLKALPASAFGVAQGEGNWGDSVWWNMSKNRANTSAVFHHGKCLALWEVGTPYEMTLPELETVGPYRFGGAVDGNFSAHPKVDARTGELMAVSYQLFGRLQCSYRVFDSNGSLIHEVELKGLKNPVMMHDCSITEQHTLVLDMPLVFDPTDMSPMAKFFKFDAQAGSRIGVMPRFGEEEDVKWLNVDPCFILHTINAFERGDEVVVHCVRCSAQSMAANELLDIDGRLHEYVLNLKTGDVRERSLPDFGHSIGMPTINEALLGRRCRFCYATAVCDEPGGRSHTNGIFNRVLKFDLEDCSSPPLEYVLPEGWFTSQFAFAPRDSASGGNGCGPVGGGRDASDDGWLVGLSSDFKTGATEVVVLDAGSMEVVTRLEVPLRVPFGFHAIFVPEHQLAPVAAPSSRP